ncbi:MAG: translation initiation factor IF-2 [Synergistetes bacterium]|nr:translation initiation factor IF-2 [Synergistota bacterium]MCX8128190.1 translation initiation factor IF-2 [Synergistota bacterium]MDW8192566.1 translation initiation factor IF-2 [Synergistota bacterium]
MIGLSTKELMDRLKDLGVEVKTHMSTIDTEVAKIIEEELLEERKRMEEIVEEKKEEISGVQEIVKKEEKPIIFEPRPPVVTVMGHVDHGKTTLLDTIRKTNVAEKEAGGITQKIGASVVERGGKKIVFIDTPGHEAFTKMRARGAQVTDIAVLVVAADDGVKPQTIEAVNHARAAGVPIVVAINKIDKPSANVEKTKKELSEIGLIPEEWGGDTICVEVSAKKGMGVEELLDMIIFLAEYLELKAEINVPAEGYILESRLDKGKGPVASAIVKKGVLRRGDVILTKTAYGRVRAMLDDKGRQVNEAGPSMPVEIIGLNSLPEAGDSFRVVASEKEAKEAVEAYFEELREKRLSTRPRKITLEEFLKQAKEEEAKELRLVIKTNAQGELDALVPILERLSTEEIKVKCIHGGIGNINENDVMLASASEAIIIGFNVKVEPNAKQEAEKEGIQIRLYQIIYDVEEDIKAAMIGMLKPKYEEVFLGKAEVRAIFKVRGGKVAGCYVLDGTIVRNANVRVKRKESVIYEGKISSLKRFKDDVKEVAKDYECGIGIDGFSDFEVGDIIEAFEVREVRRTTL